MILRRLSLASALLVASTAAAQEGQGFAELRASWSIGATGKPLQLVERVRPTFSTAIGERSKLVATLEASLAEGRNSTDELRRAMDDAGLSPLLAAAGCSWPSSANSALHVDGASSYLAVDRLYLDHYGERFDLRLGRQALHWGSAQFFNPTDPFPEVLLTEPWRPRAGVNALRAHAAFSGLTDLTAVLAVDDAIRKGRAALRLRTNRWGVDAALVGAWRGGSGWMAGLDLRGTLGVGWWIEAAVHPSAEKTREELAVGVDYSFPVLEKLVLTAQYYRNGAGAAGPDQYSWTSRLSGAGGAGGPTCADGSPLGPAPADAFGPFALARDYLLASVALQIFPELSVNAAFLQNLNDGTGVAVPAASWAALDWLELSLSAQVPVATWGHGGEFKPRPGDLLLERDLGPLGAYRADLSGLVPRATLTFWTRASF
jgi:hypothetical protein